MVKIAAKSVHVGGRPNSVVGLKHASGISRLFGAREAPHKS